MAAPEGYISIDIVGTAASVRVDMDDWTGHRFTDFFTLVKIDGRWQIISKVFTCIPELPRLCGAQRGVAGGAATSSVSGWPWRHSSRVKAWLAGSALSAATKAAGSLAGAPLTV